MRSSSRQLAQRTDFCGRSRFCGHARGPNQNTCSPQRIAELTYHKVSFLTCHCGAVTLWLLCGPVHTLVCTKDVEQRLAHAHRDNIASTLTALYSCCLSLVLIGPCRAQAFRTVGCTQDAESVRTARRRSGMSQMSMPRSWTIAVRPPASVSQASEAVHATACFVAISLSFLVYGVLQERMMTVGFGPDRELFQVFAIHGILQSSAHLRHLAPRRAHAAGSVKPVAPLQSYAAVSLANLIASTCQYDSLKYVSFALQTLAKCCKMLPVMVWGVIIRKKRYNFIEVSTAACVVAGCAAFIFSGNVLSKTADAALSMRWYGIGCALLLLYLAFDGFASTCRTHSSPGYEMETSNQVLYTSLCSMALSLVVLIVTARCGRPAGFLRGTLKPQCTSQRCPVWPP